MTVVVATEALRIPASHVDLVTRPICAVLTTLGPDGSAHSSLCWVDVDEAGCARFNTTLERQHGRSLRRDPRATLLIVDPGNTGRFLQLRGEVELATVGAEAHLDALTRRYTRHEHYYGGIVDAGARGSETRVTGTLHARRITLDAIHG